MNSLNTLPEYVSNPETYSHKREFKLIVSFEYFITNQAFKKTIRLKDIPANIDELQNEFVRVLDEIQNLSVGQTLSDNALYFLVALYTKVF